MRFRRGIIDIIDVSSPVGLGGGLVDGAPSAVDDEFVQDPFPPGNANSSGESGRTLVQTNGTRPLLEKKKIRRGGSGSGTFLRAYLIKGSGDDDLVGIVWPVEGENERLTGK